MKSSKNSFKGTKRTDGGNARRKPAPKPANALGRGDVVEGVIQGTGKGYAFFIPDGGAADLFIPAKSLGGAIHGDRVVARKVSGYARGGEGEVLKIVSRKYTEVVGVFDGSEVVCSERGLGKIKCARANTGIAAESGDLVVAELISSRFGLACSIKEKLGKSGETETDITGVVRSYGIPDRFPSDVEAEANAIPDAPAPEQLRGRRDFRRDTVITIDGEHSKDFDDAVSVKATSDGGYLLAVHIADVSEYVVEGSRLDAEAYDRGTSVYFADRVVPMLPEKISNGVCSLVEGEDRLTLSVVMRFNSEAEVISHEICNGVIRSSARTTYEGVQAALDGKETSEKYKKILPTLETAAELADKLRKKRRARGSVELDVGECEIILDGDEVKDVVLRERLFSHMLIEEFMLVTNETVAEHFEKLRAPFVFRVHENPPSDKLDALRAFLSSLGLKLSENPSPSDYGELIASAPDELKTLVSRAALRSMAKAEYRPQNLGHFGLAAKYYCHFTSPIRRYPDLAIHRVIKYFLSGGTNPRRFNDFVRTASVQSSEREKRAEEAERRVDDVLKAKFMKNKIGECFEATVSGVTDRGIFAELDNCVEGMIKVEELPGSGYEYDEERLTLRSPQRTFRFGDRIKIKVSSVSLELGKIAFALAE